MIIGLTGGLATGKSTVAIFFQRLGVRVVDADIVARRVVSKGTDAWREIIEVFGQRILRPDGEIDRSKLADLIFNDNDLREDLNRITHPRIRLEIEHEIKRTQNPEIFIIDAPLLIEAGMDDLVQSLIVVNLDYEEEIKRVIERDNLSRREAMERISAQMPLSSKLERADFIIDNNGSLEDTEAQVEKIWKELIQAAD